MTSKLTRERLEKINSWRETYGAGSNVMLPAEEAEELARIALAAMDSEPVAYIFKHPAGRLFWALTDESNKGQSDVMPVYAEPQPAPVVPDDLLSMAASAIEDLLEHTDPNTSYYSGVWADMPGKLRAAMLQAGNYRENASSSTSNCREIAETSTNSPVIGIDPASGPDCSVEVRYVAPPGYVMVPMRLTAENGAKGALSGVFSETKFVNCPECFGDDECETCDGSGRIEITVPVTWTTIKEIWAKGVEHFATAPQEVK